MTRIIPMNCEIKQAQYIPMKFDRKRIHLDRKCIYCVRVTTLNIVQYYKVSIVLTYSMLCVCSHINIFSFGLKLV